MHKKKICRRTTNLKIKKNKKKIQIKTAKNLQNSDYAEDGIYKNINQEITKSLLKNVPQVQKGHADRLLKNKTASKKLNQLQRSDKQKQEDQNKQNHIEVEEMSMEELQKLLGIQKQEPKEEEFTKKKLNLTLDEKWAVEKIYKKHKTNFYKAFMDDKVNTFTWNENQMKKKFEAYEFKHGPLKD